MAFELEKRITEATGATRCREAGVVQELWSGYGRILRYELDGGGAPSLIVKHISPPGDAEHPRGWNTDRSHQRKLNSYRIESEWYRDYARRCGPACRVPRCLAMDRKGDELLFLLEDLDVAGFPERRVRVTDVGCGVVCGGWRICTRPFSGTPARACGSAGPTGTWRRGRMKWHGSRTRIRHCGRRRMRSMQDCGRHLSKPWCMAMRSWRISAFQRTARRWRRSISSTSGEAVG